jgi:pyruvate dehydrogenase E2 component (dihydrolipoamide acetyltransferase)
MAQLLRMPEVSANTVEAVLSEWPLAENAAFSAGDAIATVETEKAVVDVPADADGVLLRTLIEPGKTVTVGTPMAVLAAPGEVIDDLDALVAELTGGEVPPRADDPTPAGAREVSQAAAPAAGSAPGPAPAPVNGARPDTTPPSPPGVSHQAGSAPSSSASATSAPSPTSPGPASAPGPAVAPNSASASGPTSMPGPADAAPVSAAGERVFASPLARRIAKENGLEVADIPGTGPGGRIVRDDVRRALAQRVSVPGFAPTVGGRDGEPAQAPIPVEHAPAPVTAGAAATPVWAGAVGTTGTGYHDIPHTRMRRAIAARLAESHREAPVFMIRGSARVDALLALRKDLNATDLRISVNDLIVAAAARAHVTVPQMNAIWMPDAVRQFDDVDIAIAVATGTGLVTPVVRGVQRLSISALARVSADAVIRARDGKLRQGELEGGALTVTNLGVFGTEDFTAVINPPQAAILAVGAARQEAVVTEGDLGVATVLRVTLSVDHRPVDGATAAKWMAAFLALLESPLRILA